MLIGVLTGLFWGTVNGALITRLKINPFIVTLGTLGIVRGLTLIISNGLPVHRIPQSFSFLGEGTLLGVPFVLWILVGCARADARASWSTRGWAATPSPSAATRRRRSTPACR